MKLHRMYAILLRHFYAFRHSFDRWTEAFYWPTLDLIAWGLTSLYFIKLNPDSSAILMMIVSGILLWMIVYRSQYALDLSILDEMWNKNLVNLFVSPLTFAEWITSLLFLGFIKSLISFIYASILAFILYKTQIFTYGPYLLPFYGLLILTGWWLGFLIAGLILRYGTKVQAFAWTLVAVISPFSAIYYPLSILPEWAQVIARIIPTSYVFEGARQVLYTGTLNWNSILISLGLNIVFIILSFLYMKASFKKVLDKGLVKVF